MPELVTSINCPKCGGPLNLTTGEVIVTCPYCGTASRIRGDKPFVLTHSMLTARMDRDRALRAIQGWMEGGVMKPDDLRRAARVTSLECVYLPFYVFEVDATTAYAGVLTRTGTNEKRTGNLRRDYFWKVLGRRSGDFPTREYKLPLGLKVPFDTGGMVRESRFLNAEVDEDEAERLTREDVDGHQRELLKELVDVIEDARTQVDLKDSEFLHAPIWFSTFEYRGRAYTILLDAASADDLPGCRVAQDGVRSASVLEGREPDRGVKELRILDVHLRLSVLDDVHEILQQVPLMAIDVLPGESLRLVLVDLRVQEPGIPDHAARVEGHLEPEGQFVFPRREVPGSAAEDLPEVIATKVPCPLLVRAGPREDPGVGGRRASSRRPPSNLGSPAGRHRGPSGSRASSASGRRACPRGFARRCRSTGTSR